MLSVVACLCLNCLAIKRSYIARGAGAGIGWVGFSSLARRGDA